MKISGLMAAVLVCAAFLSGCASRGTGASPDLAETKVSDLAGDRDDLSDPNADWIAENSHDGEDFDIRKYPADTDFSEEVFTAYHLSAGVGGKERMNLSVPRISSGEPNAEIINDSIVSFANSADPEVVGKLFGGDFSAFLRMGYDYFQSGGLLGVFVDIYSGADGSESVSDIVRAFYYDMNEDKILTDAEFLAALGYDIDELLQIFDESGLWSDEAGQPLKSSDIEIAAFIPTDDGSVNMLWYDLTTEENLPKAALFSGEGIIAIPTVSIWQNS